MINYILRCSKCGQMYKCIDKQNDIFITDFGDRIQKSCIKCQSPIDENILCTQDWIANLVFTIKGK